MTTIARFGLVSLNILVFFVEEAWIIVAVAVLPFWLAIIVVTVLLALFSILSTYLCGLGNLPPLLERWMARKKEKAEQRLEKVVKGTVWSASLVTAIMISPTTSAVMLSLAGINSKRAYLVDGLFSLVSGSIWCLIYGGVVLSLRELL